MSCKRSEIVKQMQSWVGLKESDGSHKKIIDIYNAIQPLPVGYKMKYTDDWCAATVSAVAKVCDALDIIPAECSCPRMVEQLKKKGIWEESDDHVPQPGDLIFYDWDDSTGKGDNVGNPDHVGVVEKISGDTIIVIEGNYQNSVMRRHIRIGARYIRGFGVPKYDAEAKAEEKKQEGFTMEMRYLSKGCKGDDVKALQILLNGRGYSCGTVDGDFGTKTDKALRRYQTAEKLGVGGVAGPQTMGRLLGVGH